jgi:hypothetical protein
MSWVDTTFEKAMKRHFVSKLGEPKGEHLYGEYTSVRNAMEGDNFFKEIKGQEPDLSDHSEQHIQDVFERAFKVIGEVEFIKFSPKDIYCLALMILFHDVGNIYGRVRHNAVGKIAEVYNKYRSNVGNYRNEKKVITLGASAHCGKLKNGSRDTLKGVNDSSIGGDKIRLKELSAILRFSDELAEGKQRTCSFLLDKGLISKESNVYHHYAQVTDIEIDRNLERISITYDINIPKDFNAVAQEEFKELMLFSYHRAVKLDIERRYTKYYSDVLKQFKYVSVQYNFSIDEIPIQIELNRITFEDRYPIPGEGESETKDEAEKIFIKMDEAYDLTKLIESINSKNTQ